MESTETTKDQIELIQTAIQKLIQQSKQNTHLVSYDDDRQLLDKLLSQLKALKAEREAEPSEPFAQTNEVSSCELGAFETKGKDDAAKSGIESTDGGKAEDVIKELKKLERQNRLTHWLLSALILLTLAWQLSEVSLLLKLKHGLTHPFKSLGSMVAGVVKGPPKIELEAPEPSMLTKKNGIDTLDHLQVPHFELSELIDEEHK